MSTATLSAPAKTRTARKSASLADLIVAETAIHSTEPAIQPPTEDSAPVIDSFSTVEDSETSIASNPLCLFLVAAIVVFALAQTAIAFALIATKVAKFITKKALAFAKAQMGSKPKPDYSPIFMVLEQPVA
jgi:hypothetical protein